MHKLISSCFGIGYIGKGAGTVAATATCLVWYFVLLFEPEHILATILVTALLTLQGIRSANVVEADWGKDHQRVVIDEVAGMCVTLLFVPVDFRYIFVGLVLFRFFDIVKPFYIKKLEHLPGGLGVMADDLLAGIYANSCLQLLIYFGLF
ncbi:phosphatidylglycerophosphatase A [Daejeonella rubra]|uniref:Phosphatidylglycerophosphatase A n=1 Tax=Daejeonella rubra TaxID=990371 RepID=A0A1G9UQB8_9SPHI|nr:phosphatidylglycerophosphatase A [Daejeonella rubra]SDM62053.1 phosphatidylglycerophosphatase A [Daejeonella rubra]